MPALNSVLNDLKAPGYKCRAYLAVFTPSIVLTASVSATPANSANVLAITITGGAIADVYRGFLCRVESAGGVLKGVTNVRAAGTLDATHLAIHELANADIPIVSGDVVKVYNIPYLGDKLPTADSAFAPDDLVYTNQGSAIRPRVNSGGHFIGFVDGVGTPSQTAYATVPMSGVSTTEDPASSGALTHLWTLLTGTLSFAPGSASTDANPTIRAAAGYGLLLHTETDSTNGTSWTQFVCFQVYDLTGNLPYRLLNANLRGTQADGWTAENVEVYANATLSQLWDGAFGGLFVRETINGQTVSYGNAYAGRSHIKLLGFLSHDDQALTPQIRRLTFTLRGALAQALTLPGFSKVFARSETGWAQLSALTVRLVIIQLIRYYTYFTEMFDLEFDADFLNKAYPAYYLQKKTVIDQLREVSDGVDARITNTRTGELLVHTRPELISLASRAAVTKTMTLATWMWLKATLSRDHWKLLDLYEARGFSASATSPQPILSRYPSLTPGRGAQNQVVERQIADTQADLNDRAGRRGARIDGSYFDANGLFARAVEWTGTLWQSLDVFDFYKEYCDTSFDGTTNLRAIDLSAYLYYLNEIRVTYNATGATDVQPDFLMATNAPAAATWIPPDTGSVLPPAIVPPPPLTNVNPTSSNGLWTGVNALAVFNDDGYVYLYSNLQSDTGWSVTRYNLAALAGWSGSGCGMFIVEAHSPLYLGTGTTVEGALFSDTTWFYITDIAGTPVLSNARALRYNVRSMQGSRAVAGRYGIAMHEFTAGTGGVDVLITDDKGVSWTSRLDQGVSWVGGVGNGLHDGMYVDEHSPAGLVTSFQVTDETSQLQRSTNDGASWTALGRILHQGMGPITVPYPVTDMSVIYHGGTLAPGDPYSPPPYGTQRTWKTVGGVTTDISPMYHVSGADRVFGPINEFGLKACDVAQNELLLVADDSDINYWGVWRSHDGGTSWVNIIPPDDPSIVKWRGGNFAGNSPNTWFLWGDNGALMFTNDDGATFHNRSAVVAYPSAGQGLNIAGV